MAVNNRPLAFARLAIVLAIVLAPRAEVGATGNCLLQPNPAGQIAAGQCFPSCQQKDGGCCLEIDPTGKHIFKQHPPLYHKEPHPLHEHISPSGVIIWPRRVVAPVGSEVVMVAGICDKDGHLRSNEEVEFNIAPGGVGHFLGIGSRHWIHSLSLLGQAPKKIDNTYAVSTTMGRYVCLTRGTPSTEDDVPVQKGQTWVTLTSPVEGTSYVTAFGPTVYGWDRRQQTSEIYWVDAQWQFPPPAVNPLGTRHTFTTVVSKFSNRAPVIGWRVRYEITGGPDAGFSPDGAKVVEVPTNELGQASAEIFQTVPAAGTNTISIQVIRPADSATGNQRMVMGTGSTSKTWSSPDISLRKTGPAQAAVGATINYRLDITNPSSATARDVVVTDQIPPGMTHLGSNPQATIQGQQVQWRLGDLVGGQSRTIEFAVRIDQPGTFNNCANLTTAEGLTAQDCVSTTVMAATVDVRVAAPEQATVGQDVTFQVTITNRGATPMTGLRVKSTFDAGLQHAVAASPLERDLQTIGPGQTQQVAITLKAAQAGRLCNTVEILSANAVLGTAQSCVNAVAGPAPAAPALQVEKTGPSSLAVGEIANFDIVITNNGTVAVNELKVTDNYDTALDPVRATDGYRFVGDDLVWLIDTLPPGRQVRLQIQCRCQQPIARACNRIAVTTREGATANGEACLEIRAAGTAPPLTNPVPAAANPLSSTPPPSSNPATTNPPFTNPPAGSAALPGSLNVSVSDRRDPVQVQRELIYEVRITNTSSTPVQRVVLQATASSEMQPIAPGTLGPSRAVTNGQQVQFGEYASLGPNESLVYTIGMRALRPGTARLSVQVSSAGGSPITKEETTQIVAQ